MNVVRMSGLSIFPLLRWVEGQIFLRDEPVAGRSFSIVVGHGEIVQRAVCVYLNDSNKLGSHRLANRPLLA
jgi:hypothetical protein